MQSGMALAEARSAPPEDGEAPQIVLRTEAGLHVVVRLVHFGRRFGPARQLVNTGSQPIVEFLAPGARLTRYFGSLPLAEFRMLAAHGFTPGGEPALAISRDEIARAFAWLDARNATTPEEANETVFLVGDDDRTARLGAALSRLPLVTRRFEDGRTALGNVALTPPALVLVTDGVRRMATPVLVKEMRRALGARRVPIVVIGGESPEALGAGADAHLADGAGKPELEALVSDLLELI
jgi:hypothetical protein